MTLQLKFASPTESVKRSRQVRLAIPLVVGLSIVLSSAGVVRAVGASSPRSIKSASGVGRLRSTCPPASVQRGFARPGAVVVHGRGKVFVANDGRHQVLVLSPSGRILHCLPMPLSADNLAVYGHGYVYAASSQSGRIIKIGPRGHLLWSAGGNGRRPGRFRTIGGMAVTSGGKLFVADYNGQRIQTLTPNGRRWSGWSTRGLGSHQHPDSIAVQQGRVYVGFAADNTPVGGFIAEFSKHGQLIARRWADVSPDEITVGLRGDLWVVSEVLCAGCVQGNLTRFALSGRRLQSWNFVSPPLAVDDRRLADVRVYEAKTGQNVIVVRKPSGKTIAVWK